MGRIFANNGWRGNALFLFLLLYGCDGCERRRNIQNTPYAIPQQVAKTIVFLSMYLSEWVDSESSNGGSDDSEHGYSLVSLVEYISTRKACSVDEVILNGVIDKSRQLCVVHSVYCLEVKAIESQSSMDSERVVIVAYPARDKWEMRLGDTWDEYAFSFVGTSGNQIYIASASETDPESALVEVAAILRQGQSQKAGRRWEKMKGSFEDYLQNGREVAVPPTFR